MIQLSMYRNFKNLSEFERNILVSVCSDTKNLKGYPHISEGNTKADHAGYNESCINCNPECFKFFSKLGIKCYAQSGNYQYPKVFKGIAKNTYSYLYDKKSWYETLSEEVRKYNTFRFFFTGDLIDYQQFCLIVDIAKKAKKTECYMFTKAYEYVNQFVNEYGLKAIPENLVIIFSEIPGRAFKAGENPYNFPTAKIIKDHETFMKVREIGTDKFCYHTSKNGITCFECRKCINLKHGQNIYLPQI